MKTKRKWVGVPKAEKHLVNSLLKGLSQASGISFNTVYRLELDCFQGVADVVTARPNGHSFLPAGTKLGKLRRFSLSTAKVLSALRSRKKAHIVGVENATGLSRATVRSHLRILETLGFVQLKKRGLIQVVHSVSTPFRDIAAYEVKVKDWKSGLRQARSYKSFANRSNLVLPLERLDRLRAKTQIFRRFNVGLLGVNNRGDIKWLYRARRTEPISHPRNILAAVYLMKGRPLSAVKS